MSSICSDESFTPAGYHKSLTSHGNENQRVPPLDYLKLIQHHNVESSIV